MQLLPCNRPAGALERAPRTSLTADSPREQWEGFWSVADEQYYTRCVRDDTVEQWYRVVDEAPRPRAREASVIPLRPRGGRVYPATHHMLLVTPADGARAILIGGSRRRAPALRQGTVEADR